MLLPSPRFNCTVIIAFLLHFETEQHWKMKMKNQNIPHDKIITIELLCLFRIIFFNQPQKNGGKKIL